MLVSDAMVVIHLAKLTLLQTSCEQFKPVVVPEAVHRELLAGKAKGSADVGVIEELFNAGTLRVKRVRNATLLKRAGAFNVQRGEAEALALYWQEEADYLASDDDTLRKRRTLLNVQLIGTPAIILALYRKNLLNKGKLAASLQALRKIGWFSNTVIDKILMEAT